MSQVLQGEARYDVVVRYQESYRNTPEAIAKIRLLSPSGERVSLAQLTKVDVRDGAYDIYREKNTRYVAVRFNVRDRDLGSTVEEAIKQIHEKVQLPLGYHIEWAGEYESQQRANKRLAIIVPITILVILIILYSMFRSAKWALLILAVVAIAPLGGLLALLLTGTHFSVSSGVGFLALFGVSVQTGVIMLEYINQLRSRGYPIVESAIEGAVLRFRPIMMTMLVATFGLLPAAMSHAIGSDSQRPFAIVIVGGLIVALAMSTLSCLRCMSGSREKRTSFRSRRNPLTHKSVSKLMRKAWSTVIGCMTFAIMSGTAFPQVPVKITLDDAIQLALHHRGSCIGPWPFPSAQPAFSRCSPSQNGHLFPCCAGLTLSFQASSPF